MTQYIKITTRKAEIELCDCPKAEAEREFQKYLGTDEFRQVIIADLSKKVEGAVLIEDVFAFDKLKDVNENLRPYFFAGDVILAKKSSEGYEMLDSHDITNFFDWFHGLEG